MNNKKGFTLIELLVTIAIIALLSSIVFASISTARDKSSIAKAVSQGKEVDKAIELSRLSSGSYPVNIEESQSIEESIGSELEEYISSNQYSSVPENITGIDNGSDIVYLSDGQYATNGHAYFKCGTEDTEVDSYVKYFKTTSIIEDDNIPRLYQNACLPNQNCMINSFDIMTSGTVDWEANEVPVFGWHATQALGSPDPSYYYCII